MFFIAGTRGDSSIAGRGMFYCPRCSGKTKYHYIQVHRAATVFFVKVANLDLLGEYIECQQCKGTFEIGVLDYNPEEEEREIKEYFQAALKKEIVMMMLADGEIDSREIKMIKDIYLDVAGQSISENEIKQEVRECKNNPETLKKYLREIFPYINENGKEILIKAAYYMLIADGKEDLKEMDLLKIISKALEITPAHLRGIIQQVKDNKGN